MKADQKSLSIHSVMPSMLMSLSTEAREAFMTALNGQARAVLADHGPFGFRSARKDAAAHEAAHAIHYFATGEHVESVKVERLAPPDAWAASIGVFWGGLTKAGNGWELSPYTAPLADLVNARHLVAGWVGEAMLRGKKVAPGSSLDEIAFSQMVCASAAHKLGMDPVKLFNEQIGVVRDILIANKAVHRALTHELLTRDEIAGARLDLLLAPVKRIPAPQPEAVADDDW